MRASIIPFAVVAALSFVCEVNAKAVFAHYMVGTVTEAHAHKDIDDAIAMELDGFALNIGDPTLPFVKPALDSLFGYAAYRGFKLYVSMDVYAYGDACYKAHKTCNGPTDYYPILSGYLGSSAWYLGPNGLPLISTFSSGGFQWSVWNNWKKSLANRMYFIPDFDETAGYYEGADAWWYYWGNLTEGVFSWESAWPSRKGFGGKYPGDISPDLPIQASAVARGKGYMMPLSTTQYKNSYGTNIYRAGELNLPVRMQNILNMQHQPDFVQIITWNDGPEGHYIGNLWPEQNTDYQPNVYANQDNYPHQAWQSLFTSFIRAYKAGGSSASMRPVSSGNTVEGVMWYKTILQSASCPNDYSGNTDMFYNKPDGFGSGADQINWAVMVQGNSAGLTAACVSNGVQLGSSVRLTGGLNYGNCGSVQPGTQRLEVRDGQGKVLSAANGVGCLSSGCPEGIYNMNYQVAALAADAKATCYDFSKGIFSNGVFVQRQYDPAANWREITCDAGSLTHAYNSGTQQWIDAHADAAWNDALYSWTHNSSLLGVAFADAIGDFFNTKPNIDCAGLGDPNCDTTIVCGQIGVNGQVNSPAGYLIINSFIGIHHQYDTFYTILQAAQGHMTTSIGDFSSTFAPLFDQQKASKIAVDVLGLAFALLAAPTWNSWLKTSALFTGNANALGTTKDAINALVSNSVTLIKDSSDAGLTSLQNQNQISHFLGDLINEWTVILQKQLTYLFSGTTNNATTLLYSLIQNGQSFNSQRLSNSTNLQPQIEKALYGIMIPVAWQYSTQNVVSFIATSDGVPQSGSGCEGLDPTANKDVAGRLSHQDGIQNFVCDYRTASAYWISNIAYQRSNGCQNKNLSPCPTLWIGTLPGISKLSGKVSDWGGITRDDLVISAVNAWKKNGQKNGWAQADATNIDSLMDIQNNGIRAAGLVNIPVCSYKEAIHNVWTRNITANYPCN